MTSLVIVIPTYNERENLQRLVEGIFSLAIPALEIVVVDDNSPDGTGAVAETLAKKYPLRVIHRKEKKGLGLAYVHAFRKILALPSAPDVIVQMDADLSHDPGVVHEMLKTIKECDLVIGSRYVPNGRIENWEFLRRMLSRWGNFYARLVTGLPYRDLTSGFKCWRRETLENIGFESLSSLGYNFQIETTFRAHKNGCRIKEIPIVFTERKYGTSKMNLGIIVESFLKVLLLRLKK